MTLHSKKRGSSRKGQAALEYAMVAVLIGVMIVPAVYLLYTYSQRSVEEIDLAQLDKLGRDIVSTGEKVYYLGPPSRILLETRMPSNVRNISIWKNPSTGVNVLVFNVSVSGTGVQSFTYSSKVNINGTFSAALADRTISPGLKQINIEAYEMLQADGSVITFAHVNLGGRCPRSTTYDFDKDGDSDGTDRAFFNNCRDNSPGPKYRPSKTWQDGWFNNPAEPNSYAVCMNADYDGDCDVDTADETEFCAVSDAC